MKCSYFTGSTISNKETLTKLCLLFDKVDTFELSSDYYLPIIEERVKGKEISADPRIKKEMLTKLKEEEFFNFCNNYKELISEGVLNPIIWNQKPQDLKEGELFGRKEMDKNMFTYFFYWGQTAGITPINKAYIDQYWYVINRFQSVHAGLYYAIKSGRTPISDNEILSRSGCESLSFSKAIEYVPTIEERASKLALTSLTLALPNFPAMNSTEILQVRYKLRNELGYFKDEMKIIAKKVSDEEFSNLNDIVLEKIQPRLDDIELKIKSIDDELFRKISSMFLIGGSATTLLSYFYNLPLPGKIAAASTAVGKICLNMHESQSKKYDLLNSSTNKGLVFLLKMKKLK